MTSIVIGLAVQTAVGPLSPVCFCCSRNRSASVTGVTPHREAVGSITASSVGMIVYAADGGRELSLGRLGVGRRYRRDRSNPQRMLTGTSHSPTPRLCTSPRDAMNIVVQQDPRFARQIGEAIEIRGARPHPKHSLRLPRACG